MEDHLLSRILTGDATPEVKEKFYSALQKDKNDEELYLKVKDLWLRTSIQNSKINEEKEFDVLWSKIQKEKKIVQLTYRRIIQYAAIAILLLGIGSLTGYFLTNPNYPYELASAQQYTSMKGSISIVEFPDGTKVWLNSDTKLTYKFDKKQKARYAELTGEAYFEVAHNDKYPFKVKAGQLIIRDLGTTFNIKAYSDSKFIETTLVEGKADILNSNNKTIVDLNPGESAVYFKEEKKIEMREVSSNVISAWRNGKIVLRNQRLEDVFKELSRWYDVDVKFENENLKEVRYTGSIKKSTSVRHILEMINLTTNIDYRIIEKTDDQDVIIIY